MNGLTILLKIDIDLVQIYITSTLFFPYEWILVVILYYIKLYYIILY
jgi:hypothetical protein